MIDKQDVRVVLIKRVEPNVNLSNERYPKENAVEGIGKTIWHTYQGWGTDWIEVDLEEQVEISNIGITQGTGTTVYNGVASWARMSGGGPDSTDKGSYIIIKDAAKSEVKKTEDIKMVASKYTYDFTKEGGTWA